MTIKRRIHSGLVQLFFFIGALICAGTARAVEADTDGADGRAQMVMLRTSDMLTLPRVHEPSHAAPAQGSASTYWPALSLRMSDGLMRASFRQASSGLQKLSNRASDLALAAMSVLGTQYRLGGSTPEHGLDCSGLVGYVFMQSWGAVLPRTAAQIGKIGQKVKTQDLQPGDLVFYNTVKRGISHVGIYLGDNKFIHSPSAGGQVRIDSMDLAYWKRHFTGARRIESPQQQNGLAVRETQ